MYGSSGKSLDAAERQNLFSSLVIADHVSESGLCAQLFLHTLLLSGAAPFKQALDLLNGQSSS